MSVANLTRQDALSSFDTATRADVRTHVTYSPLSEANASLDALRNGRMEGAAVLVPAAAITAL